MLVGLAVHGDERLADPRQRRRGHRGAAQEGARATLGGDLPAQQQLAGLDLTAVLLGDLAEARVGTDDALDAGRTSAGAHRAGVGPAAQQEPERGDEHGLAGAGLAGDHGQPLAELEHGLLDDAQGADPDLLDHRVAVTGARSACAGQQSRASPRRGARTWRRGGR